jgi:hypothetical protein
MIVPGFCKLPAVISCIIQRIMGIGINRNTLFSFCPAYTVYRRRFINRYFIRKILFAIRRDDPQPVSAIHAKVHAWHNIRTAII